MNRNSRDELRPRIELVIPLYNEEVMVDELISTLRKVFSEEALEKYGIESVYYHFVDDGSTDATARKIYESISTGVPGTLHVLSRNFGHQAAVCAGLDACQADLVAVIDGDLQDPPELLFEMLGQWRAGNDVIYGVRSRRQEFFLKKFAYWLFYRILGFLAEIEIPRDAGDFCLMDQKVVAALKKLPEIIRFQRGLRAWVGFRQCAVPYSRPKRKMGSSKYSFLMLYRLATDGIASMSTRVLQVTQLFTFLFALGALVISICLTRVLMNHDHHDPIFFWFIIGCFINTMIGFMTMFALYIMSAFISRTYLEAKHRPTYIVSETLKAPNEDR